MEGFNRDTVYATNVDFSGAALPSPRKLALARCSGAPAAGESPLRSDASASPVSERHE